MNYSVTKIVNFCCSHRLFKYVGRCANIHGHNYSAEITIMRKNGGITTDGFVLDFREIKETIAKFIDSKFDHAMVIHEDDKTVRRMFAESQFKVMIMDCNPTAENMAKFIMASGNSLLSTYDVYVSRVKLFETPTSFVVLEAE